MPRSTCWPVLQEKTEPTESRQGKDPDPHNSDSAFPFGVAQTHASQLRTEREESLISAAFAIFGLSCPSPYFSVTSCKSTFAAGFPCARFARETPARTRIWHLANLLPPRSSILPLRSLLWPSTLDPRPSTPLRPSPLQGPKVRPPDLKRIR